LIGLLSYTALIEKLPIFSQYFKKYLWMQTSGTRAWCRFSRCGDITTVTATPNGFDVPLEHFFFEDRLEKTEVSL